MIEFGMTGSFKNTENFFKRMASREMYACLDKYAREGVAALSNATPMDTGKTASSWTYEIQRVPGKYKLIFRNTYVTESGTPVIVLIQYGHGTGTGGYVQGRDNLNPVLQPIFDKIADEAWKVVTKQ